MTDVEKLIDKMADKLFTAFRPYVSDGMCDVMAKELLKEVLSEIKNGGAVDYTEEFIGTDKKNVVLKLEFEKLLNKK